MADERERQGEEAGKAPAGGRPERYPQVRQDDAIERTAPGEARSFDPASGAATSRRAAGSPSSEGCRQDGFSGPQGDPAEGKP